jgi:hypothetical protein
MKTFEQLTADEQTAAIQRALNDLLEAATNGAIRFDDAANGNDLQARIDAAGLKSERMRTPWFAAEYILDAARADLEAMARADAEDAVYAEPTERVVSGVLQ